jgi:hypothetical protein
MNETIPLVALAVLLGLGAGLIAAIVSDTSQGRREQNRLASEKAQRQARPRREGYEAAPVYHKAGETVRGEDLASKHLMRARLARASLQGADTRGRHPPKADLSEATLQDAKPGRATNVAASLQGTKPSAVDLEEAKPNGRTLTDARLTGAKPDQIAPNALPLPDSCEDKFLFALWLGRHLGRD